MKNKKTDWALRLARLLAALGLVALDDADPAFERLGGEATYRQAS